MEVALDPIALQLDRAGVGAVGIAQQDALAAGLNSVRRVMCIDPGLDMRELEDRAQIASVPAQGAVGAQGVGPAVLPEGIEEACRLGHVIDQELAVQAQSSQGADLGIEGQLSVVAILQSLPLFDVERRKGKHSRHLLMLVEDQGLGRPQREP